MKTSRDIHTAIRRANLLEAQSHSLGLVPVRPAAEYRAEPPLPVPPTPYVVPSPPPDREPLERLLARLNRRRLAKWPANRERYWGWEVGCVVQLPPSEGRPAGRTCRVLGYAGDSWALGDHRTGEILVVKEGKV